MRDGGGQMGSRSQGQGDGGHKVIKGNSKREGARVLLVVGDKR